MASKNTLQLIRQAQHPMVVDIWAAWCAPCRMIEPALASLAQEYEGRVEFVRLNADEDPQAVRSLRVMGIPTLIAVSGGQEVSRHTGAAPRASLAGLFEAALFGKAPVRTGPNRLDRALRIVAGLAFLPLSLRGRWSWLFAPVAAIVLFSAVSDRCPVWQAITARLAEAVRRDSAQAPPGEGRP